VALDFVAIDFETANSYRASACSVGLVRITDGEVDGEESFLIKPPSELGGFGAIQMGVHGIKPRDVVDARGWIEAFEDIMDFVGDDYMVAHNAAFDFSVINKSQEHFGSAAATISHFCSLELSRKALPRLDNHKLSTVSKHLGLQAFNHHVAADDALMSALICVELADRHGASSLPALMRQHGIGEKRIGGGRAAMTPAWS
jgi:DNA polymerase-3 subunit epsilon